MTRNGRPVVGLGQAEAVAPIAASSPWPMVVATSIVSAVTGLVVEEFVRSARRKRERKRR